jgi:hypothetical protein
MKIEQICSDMDSAVQHISVTVQSSPFYAVTITGVDPQYMEAIYRNAHAYVMGRKHHDPTIPRTTYLPTQADALGVIRAQYVIGAIAETHAAAVGQLNTMVDLVTVRYDDLKNRTPSFAHIVNTAQVSALIDGRQWWPSPSAQDSQCGAPSVDEK